MANYKRINPFPRILLYFFLLIGLFVGGVVWFDFLGLFNAAETFAPVLQVIGLAPPPSEAVNSSDPMILDSLRILKREEALDIRYQNLALERDEFAQSQEEFAQALAELQEREASQEDREKSFNERLEQFEDRRVALIQNSRDLTSMRPDDAVAILAQYGDQDLIDTLRITEELAQQAGEVSLVSVWLSKLPSVRAAEIQRKMTLKPDTF
jgi:flagellar protein FlbB